MSQDSRPQETGDSFEYFCLYVYPCFKPVTCKKQVVSWNRVLKLSNSKPIAFTMRYTPDRMLISSNSTDNHLLPSFSVHYELTATQAFTLLLVSRAHPSFGKVSFVNKH